MTTVRFIPILLVCSRSLFGQPPAPRDSAGLRAAAAGIQAAALESDVRFLASDAMLGRATPSAQLDSAAAFISAHLARMKVQPFGDRGDYAQRLSVGVTDFASCSSANLRGARYRWPDDVRSDRRPPNETAERDVRGQLVYIQDGWVSKSLGLDPFAHVDVRGKFAIAISQRGPTGSGGDLTSPVEAAANRGAIGLVLLPPTATDSSDDQWLGPMPRLRDSLRVGAAVVTGPWLPQVRTPPIPRFFISRRLTDSLFATELAASSSVSGVNHGDLLHPFALSPSTILRVHECSGTGRVAQASNVVALIPGSDSALNNEYIVLGAHYDGQGLHLPPVNGDSINNSALDNATGAAGLLEIANALARGPRPRRSILLAWFAGEEMEIGAHLGSAYFLSQPPVALSSIKLMINLDEIGPELENKGVIGVGYSAPALRDFVVAHTDQCAATQLLPVPNGRLDGGSDRDDFARRSIPYLAFEASGDDHSVTDEPQKIQYAAFADVVRCVYRLTWSVSQPAATSCAVSIAVGSLKDVALFL